jgi:small subunit ribosomal protein S1
MNKQGSGGNAGEDFGALLDEFEKKAGGSRQPRVSVGDVVRGKVVSVGREQAFLTLSDGRTEGMIGLEELRDDDGRITVKVGDELEARVAESGDRPGFVMLRRVVGRGPAARDDLQQAYELRLPVEGTVTVVNKGGVEVNLVGVRAFCPISQLELRPVEDPATYVGRKLTFRITKYEQDRRGLNVVVSRRVLLEEEAAVKGAELRARISVGAVLPGVVVAIKDFGAFVDLGGLEGMLPASELGFVRGVRPEEVLAVGQHLEVQILRMEKTNDPRRPERISLSLKSLAADPWDDVVAKYPVGSRLTGKVTRVEPYGAFVELAPGVEGLIHIGELSDGRQVRQARDLVKEGDQRPVTVLAIERDRRRISLGAGARADEGDASDVAAANRSSGGKLGTFGDLLKRKL